MSRESGSDQTQRTVAELLAQYGGSAESAPRRRRRRADDEDDVKQPETAPQTIIERVLSDSGRLMAIRDGDAPPQPGRRAAPEPQAPPPPAAAERTAYQPKPQVAPPQKAPQPSQQMPVPQAPPPLVRRPSPPQPAPKPAPPVPPPAAAAEQTRQVPQVRDKPSNSGMPRPEVPGRLEARLDQAGGSPSRTNITRPPKPVPPKPVPPSVQMPVPGPPREAMTEQLPRIPAKAPVDKIAALETESVLIVPPAPPKLPEPLPGNVPDAWFSDDDPRAKTDLSMAPMESTAAHPGPYVDDDSQEYAAYRAEDDYLGDDDEEGEDDDEGPAGLDDAGEADEDPEAAEPRSAGKEWLIMIGQLAVGVLGGAGLWLAFNFLWRSVPAAALVVALAVTVGLVLLVRKIRRADDLQTTVLAVLVGLIVTVSPAAMLLVKKLTAHIPVGLSTASVYPQPAGAAFEMASELGYDGVELMVWADPVSQDIRAVDRLSTRSGMPVLAVHAPCLLISQRVWSPDPSERLRRAVQAAGDLGAPTVVLHPPFRWQRKYADGFAELVSSLEDESGIAIAVENMFPVRRPLGRGRSVEMNAFKPSVDPTDVGHRNYTLDLSHSAAAHMDALELAKRMGEGLRHIHLADGSGAPKDEHMVPGRGTQPCAELCEMLARAGFDGQVVLEVNTRRAGSASARREMLAESLLFARLHLDWSTEGGAGKARSGLSR